VLKNWSGGAGGEPRRRGVKGKTENL